MSTAGLQITQMSSGYGKTDVLHNINLTVNPGEIVTVIGSNGAGKSTTLRTDFWFGSPYPGTNDVRGN
jgi:branched-chain amino acid transport system ATP-binding protein